MVVPVCFMIAAWTYALAVNFIPAYRDPADKIGAAMIGIENSEEEGEEASSHGDVEEGIDKANEVRAEIS